MARRITTTKAIHQRAEREGQGLDNQRPDQERRSWHQDCDSRVSRQRVYQQCYQSGLCQKAQYPDLCHCSTHSSLQRRRNSQSRRINYVLRRNLTRNRDHTERIDLAVTELGDRQIFLGHDWLARHNPIINWKLGRLTFAGANAEELCSHYQIQIPTTSGTRN